MTDLPESPYKGLAAFEDSELDALLFFGRERECGAVAANVLANRLTVLYGPSGVGKSSLLQAGVARRLRELGEVPVVVHDSWAEDPESALIASVRAACGDLGPTAGLVDTVAAAAAASRELHLLLDQFEEYVLYHGVDGPLSTALPELLRRPGLRVNVLLAVRDDALAELDAFAVRLPDMFANLLRLDRLDREAGRAAILGPLERYGELAGRRFSAEPALVEAVLDEVSEGRLDLAAAADAPASRDRVAAQYLQLVLERLWAHERAEGSDELRLATFRAIGGARAVVREHVQGALERLTLAEQEAAARVVRQLITPSGRKISHEAADLAEYADVEHEHLRPLLDTLARERLVRGVNGTPGAPIRYELFHDVLAPPLLAWQAEERLRRERAHAQRQRRRLRAIVAASLTALLAVAALAAFAFSQRSDARTQARQAHGRELAAEALAQLDTDPTRSIRLALQGASLAPNTETEAALRSSLIAMREKSVVRLGGEVVAASFGPRRELLLAGSSDGRLGVYGPSGRLVQSFPRQPGLKEAVWSPGGEPWFATGSADGTAALWKLGSSTPLLTLHTGAPVTALSLDRTTLLVGSGTHVRLVDLATRKVKVVHLSSAVVAAALDPSGKVFAVATRAGRRTRSSLRSARTGRRIAALRDPALRSFAFSPDGKLLAGGSYDKTARIWNARTGRLLHTLPHLGYVLAERFSPDGRQLVTASFDGAAYVWDVKSGRRQLLLVGATGAAEAAAFSPDQTEIAVAFADRLARIYNYTDGRLLVPLAGHTGAVTSIGFDRSGRTIATGSADGTVRLWTGLPLGTLRTIDRRPGPVQALFAGADPVSVAGRTARVLSPSGRVLRTVALPAPIVAAAASRGTLALADRRGDLAISSPRETSRFGGRQAAALAFEPDGTLLVGTARGSVEIWHLRSKTLEARHVEAGGPVLGLSTGGGRFLVRLAASVRVYADDGTRVSTIETTARQVVLSADGSTVATTHGDDAQLWDAATGKLLHTLAGHTSLVTDAEFSPDGQTLLTVSIDHTGRIWSVTSGRLVHELVGHFFPVRTGSFSPDGRWIVTASQFTAGLWNVRTGRLLFYLGRTAAPLTGASFSPTGYRIVTGSDDGTARIFRCAVCEPLPGLERAARARLRALR